MQSKNEFAISVYGVRCNTSYTKIAKNNIQMSPMSDDKQQKHRFSNIDVTKRSIRKHRCQKHRHRK